MGGGVELAELAENLVGFEMDAFDLVIETATLDGGPLDDGGCGGAERIAHVGLLEDFFRASASAAIGEELRGRKVSAFNAVTGSSGV